VCVYVSVCASRFRWEGLNPDVSQPRGSRLVVVIAQISLGLHWWWMVDGELEGELEVLEKQMCICEQTPVGSRGPMEDSS
jgi:hypothetical protein